MPGDLNGGVADTAAGGDDEDGFPGAQFSSIDQAGPGGDEIHADGGRLIEVQGFGFTAQAGDRNDDVFRVGAVAREAGVAAGTPDLGADPGGRAGFDDTGKVAPGRAGQGGLFHQALDVLDVAGIDRR